MRSFADVILAWPDYRSFEQDHGIRFGLAAIWKHRNIIPPQHWDVTVASAKRRGVPGVTHRLLRTLFDHRKQAPKPKPQTKFSPPRQREDSDEART